MSFEYTDHFGDTLKVVSLLGVEKSQVLTFEVHHGRGGGKAATPNVVIPMQDIPAVLESIIEVAGMESPVIPKSNNEVDAYRGWICCGEGKDYMEACDTADPAVLLAKAANLATIAREIRRRRALAAAEQSRTVRRNKVAQELSGDPATQYEDASELAQKAIDRIIATEDKKEEDKNA